MKSAGRRNLTPVQLEALEAVGAALCARRVTFDVAVDCRDLIREGKVREALALLKGRAQRSKSIKKDAEEKAA